MKKRDFRKVSDQEREIIRRDAIRMIKRGDKKKEIALFYGVHVNSVWSEIPHPLRSGWHR